jgi:probable phosphoglycerate mutase
LRLWGRNKAVVYIDGGSRGNPGDAAFGVYACDADGRPVAAFGRFLGRMTNNEAEYSGLLAALQWARQEDVQELHVRADSELMVKQMNGQYRVKSPNLKPLFEDARRLTRGFSRFAIEHVRRERNAEADRLANLAMDARGPVDETPVAGS